MARLQYLLSLMLLLLCSLQSSAQEHLGLFTQPASTRSQALGGVTPALIAPDIALGFSSPALLGQEHHSQLALSYHRLASTAHLGSASYGQAWADRGAWAVGLRYLSYGKLQGYDRWGNATGSFSASEGLLQGSYSYELTDRLRAGITFQGLYAGIESYQRWGLASDLGLNYYDPDSEMSLGISILHLGRSFSHEESLGGALPWDIQLGWSQRLAHAPFVLHLSAYDLHPRRSEELPLPRTTGAKIVRHLSFGLEFAPSDRFWLALGYRPKVAQDIHLLHGYRWAGLSGGVGFLAPRFQVSLAFTTTDRGYWSPQLSFSTDLSAPR